MASGQRPASAEQLADSQPFAGVRREFEFSDADFKFLSQLAYERSGIVLSDAKRNLVYGRLSRRLRVLKLGSFREYRAYIGSNGLEIQNFVNSIATNHTKLFREAHHFDHFRTHVATPLAKGHGARLRVWSAGCSSGEEPYTIAAVIARGIDNPDRHDIRMLATDIDTDILARAARGEFAASAADDVPQEYVSFFERRTNDRGQPVVVMPDSLRSMIAFRQLNLLGPWPFKGMFDAIFCRNVMIYFDAPTKAALVDRFTRQLKPGGWLYIGHSESLYGTHHGLRLMGRTIYRRES